MLLLFLFLNFGQTPDTFVYTRDSLLEASRRPIETEEEINLNRQFFALYLEYNQSYDSLFVNQLNRQAYLYWRTEPKKLDSLARLAIQISSDLKYGYGRADGTYMLGFYYDLIGDFDLALKYYFESLQEMTEMGKIGKMGSINEYIGIVYRLKGDFDAAQKYYLEALTIYESMADSIKIGNVFNSIANLWFDQMEYKKAEEFYQKSLRIKRKFSSPNAIASTLGNIASIKNRQGEYEEALKLAKEVVEIKRMVNHSHDLAVAYMVLGNTYENLELHKKADSLYQMAVEIDRSLDNKQALSGDIRQWAKSKKKLGEYVKARDLLKEAEIYSKTVGSLNNLRSVYEEMISIDTLLKDYKSAYFHLQLIQPLNDSLSNEQLARTMERQQIEYEFNKERDSVSFANERAMLILERQLTVQSETIFVIILALVLMALLTLFAYLQYRAKILANQELSKLNEEVGRQKNELERAIKTRDRLFSMIAHDLRAPMSIYQGTGLIIRSMLEEKEYNEIIRFTEHLDERSIQVSQLLDNLLNWALEQGNSFTYSPELIKFDKIVENCLILYKPIADYKEITLETEIEENLELWADTNSVNGILRNLINNAIKFTQTKGTIHIQAYNSQKQTIITIKDNGVGMNSSQLEKIKQKLALGSQFGTKGERGTGLGLLLVQDFVQMNHAKLEVESKINQGTIFRIIFPASQQKSSQ